MKNFISIVLGIYIITCPLTANSQVAENSNQRELNIKYAQYANDLIAKASNHDPELSQDYVFRVTAGTALPSAFAIYQNESGRPEIQINQSFIYMSVLFADILYIDYNTDQDYFACGQEYMRSLRRQVRGSIKGEVQGKPPKALIPPERLVSVMPSCSGLESLLPLPVEQRDQRDHFVINSILFIILHEIGHLRLHSRDFRGYDLSTLDRAMSTYCSSRAKEAQADRFAVEKMVELGWANALIHSPIWHVMSVTDPIANAVNDQWILSTTSTHPLSIDRLTMSYNHALNLSEKKGEVINKEVKDIIDKLSDALSRRDFVQEMSLRDLGFLSLNLESCR